jgi:cellulose synthase/poly-beta-1,6-N-acetylglucosamine synthase-like glycosyltransferase
MTTSIPEPCCWTVVPHRYARLAKQRARWSQILAEALWAHRAMMFDPRYGKAGLVVLPFYLIFELASAVVEILAMVSFVAGSRCTSSIRRWSCCSSSRASVTARS